MAQDLEQGLKAAKVQSGAASVNDPATAEPLAAKTRRARKAQVLASPLPDLAIAPVPIVDASAVADAVLHPARAEPIAPETSQSAPSPQIMAQSRFDEPVSSSDDADTARTADVLATAAIDSAEPEITDDPASSNPAPIGASAKDTIMDMPTSTYNASGFGDAMADAQDKTREAFGKSSAMLGDVGEFARGNVEACVEAGKVLAAGLQDLGTNFVAEGRAAFEALTADMKELAAAKTPGDFFRIQSELLRKSMDGAVSYGSKNSEAVMKLASEVIEPLSGRVNVAMDKARVAV